MRALVLGRNSPGGARPARHLARLAAGWLLVAALAPAARAECTRAYVGEELVNDLSTMTAALRSLDEAAFKASGKRLEASVACIKTPVPPMVFAAAYRYIGAYHFFSGDQDGARRWFRSALELDPTFDWDVSEVPVGHPMRGVFDGERDAASVDPVPVEGKVLNVPAGSALYLDGREIDAPAATPDRPHLLQVVATSDRTVRQVFMIDGNAFPPQFLRDAEVAAAPEEPAKKSKKDKKSKKKKGKDDEAVAEAPVVTDPLAVQKVERVRPAIKTPLMVTGGLVMAGSGVIYAMSFASHKEFERASTTSELERYRTLTNTLVLASGGTLLAGIGIEYAGIMLGTGAGFTLGGRF